MHRSSVSADKHKRLFLYVPGLFGGGNGAIPTNPLIDVALPVLETWLARAESTEHALPSGLETSLFALFGLHGNNAEDLPVAAVMRALDMGVVDNDWWLRADPVHLGLNRDQLILTPAATHGITQEEANHLAADIMQVFAADGWLLKTPRPDRWYLKPANAPKITTTPLSEVVGRDIRSFLPRGADGKSWHTTLNEVQILLHATDVNTEREQNGRSPINSLWFWGGGQLPAIKPTSWSQLWSTEPLSLSLAHLCATPSAPTPATLTHWLHQAPAAGEHLVVFNGGLETRLYDDASWTRFMEKLERDWISPLWQALKDGALADATLMTDTGQSFSLSRWQTRRWWRRRRPVMSYA